ncbi:hypothetical protein EDD16DRAFT_1706250 [Pisolithus croceorrhizus]|nr:hypothetical protein EDD16DRAFT_1706250 [Pisolithus croceorrhizus]
MRDSEDSIKLYRATLELLPLGHPEMSSVLRGLALCLSNRHDKLGVVDDLEEAITIGRAALELCPRGHREHGKSLQCLARDLRKRFAQKALELHHTGHLDRFSSLYELALCLSHRHDKHGVADDLEEAILLGHEALKLRPPGHHRRAAVLYSLACDLWKKFQVPP